MVTLVGHVEDALRCQQYNQNPYGVKSTPEGGEQRYIIAGNMPAHTGHSQRRHGRKAPMLLSSMQHGPIVRFQLPPNAWLWD